MLHAAAKVVAVVGCHGASYLQVAVVAVGDGYVYDHRPVGVEVVYGLAEHEEQCACVSP